MANDSQLHYPLSYSVKDAAARIGISRTRCYELVKSGEIRSISIGGRIVIAEAELQRVVAEPSREVA
jgi:excisionase family DNA binding protein